MNILAIAAVVWFSAQTPLTYNISRSTEPVVQTALEMMCSDLEEVTGAKPKPSGFDRATLRIIQHDVDNSSLTAFGVPGDIADSLNFVKEAFYIAAKGKKILVVGSDARGTAYGILEISRLAGVSPWIWWGDNKPEKKSRLELPEGYSSFQHPSIEYRGFFLNDEDWAFRPWSAMHYSPQEDKLTISADTYREMFRLLLRLRANTIWPGMHNGTTAFFQIPGAKEAADSCGIHIGTSHCEPLLRNNVGEWNIAERGAFNYLTNKDGVQKYWTERLEEVKTGDNLFTIGMRGIHDGSMEGLGNAGLDRKTEALQEVINDQRELLKKHLDTDVTRIPQMFMPYKEVLEIMENGLNLPDDVTIVWCDDNYGYMTRLSDSGQQKRSGGAGVYYHISYAGRPHDYLWLTTQQPGLIYNEMRQAYDHNVRKLWVVNVNSPKKASYDLELFLDMAWNINNVSPDRINAHLESWLIREYGKSAGKMLAGPMAEFYRLCSIRKPEHMGWSQVELSDKNRYPGGLSPVSDTDFSFYEFGDEAQRYIDQFRAVRRAVEEAGKFVPERNADSFFAQILYPVCATESMAEKMLYAQKARSRIRTTYSPYVWQTDTVMMTACALSQKAYQDIRNLTAEYDRVSNGKWKGAMSMMPRDLPVFRAPTLPVYLNEAEVEMWSAYAAGWKATDAGNDFISRNAKNYTKASFKPSPVQNLGHSASAVPIPKGEWLEYDIEIDRPYDDGQLTVAVLPTQANDKGDIRFSISIDGAEAVSASIKEPFRSDRWKENVMRNQARVTFPVRLAAGKHSLRIKAEDDHIVLDQWIIDFKQKRKYYVIPQ